MSKLAEYGGKIGSELKDYAKIAARDARWVNDHCENYLNTHPRTTSIIWGALSAGTMAESMYGISHDCPYSGIVIGLLSLNAGGMAIHTLDKMDKSNAAKK
jgi:hypothetical protein